LTQGRQLALTHQQRRKGLALSIFQRDEGEERAAAAEDRAPDAAVLRAQQQKRCQVTDADHIAQCGGGLTTWLASALNTLATGT